MIESLTPKQLSAIQRVVRNPELQPLLFRKARGLKWFDSFNAEGFFSAKYNPRPIPSEKDGSVSIPFWAVTEYLVDVSDELSFPDNKDYASKVLDIIRAVTLHAKKESYSNFRTWWQLSKVIRNIPIQLILPEDIDLVDYWLEDPYEGGLVAGEIGEKWLPELLGNLDKTDKHGHQIALQILDCIYRIKPGNKMAGSYGTKEESFRYNFYYAERITKRVAELSGSRLGKPSVELFENRLVSVLDNGDNDAWSSIWRSAIEENNDQKIRHRDTKIIILVAYRDCLLGFVHSNTLEAIEYVQSLFSTRYQTLHRIGIYALHKRFRQLKNLVDIIIDPKFFHDNYRHELWHFLNNHYRELSPNQQDRIVEILEGLIVADEGGDMNEKSTFYHRAIWLSAIKDFDGRFKGLYKKYTQMAGGEPEHPDFASYMKVGWVDHKSPISVEHLLSINTDMLVETINNYEDPGHGRFDEPGLEGLVKTFKDVVKAKSTDIYDKLMKFMESDLAFVYQLIEAYHDLWNEKEGLPWNDVCAHLLNFCLKLIERDSFWSAENARDRSHFVANRHWIVGAIGQLIQDGTKSDEHAFDKSLLPIANKILSVLLVRQDGEEFKLDSDAVFVAINSPRGRCLEGLINLTLRSCRLAQKQCGDHGEAWSQYEEFYELELKRREQGEYEFATLVAMFLPNFNYLSHQWVLSHLDDIFDQSDYQSWLCAMQGYSYVNRVYDLFFGHLKRRGDFLKALDDDNLKERVRERIIQNIVVAFINDFEGLNQSDSLVVALLSRKNIGELNQLIWFMSTLRDKSDEKLKEKAYELWPLLLGLVDVSTEEGRILASSLSLWASFVEKIDSATEPWLLEIAPYADVDHNASDFLESLAEISERQPIEAQKIWIKMLESYSYDYPEEAFRKIFKNLIALGDEGIRKAKEVVDAYIRHGIDRPRAWLKEIMANNGNLNGNAAHR